MTTRFSRTYDRYVERVREQWRHRVTYVGCQPDSTLRAAMMMNAMACLAATVPTLVVAWRLPDDDPADYDGEEAHV
jgi:hypothetical protein